jgi:hypothetical protein
MSGSSLRQIAAALAQEDASRALDIAQSIGDPWYRCQALSSVAERLEGQARSKVLAEALDAALHANGPNRIVTVSSWPLRILSRIGAHDRVVTELGRLTALLDEEPHPVRRMDALMALLLAVLDGPASTIDSLRARLLIAIRAAHGWKRDRHLEWLVEFHRTRGEPSLAQQMASEIESPRVRRRALRRSYE